MSHSDLGEVPSERASAELSIREPDLRPIRPSPLEGSGDARRPTTASSSVSKPEPDLHAPPRSPTTDAESIPAHLIIVPTDLAVSRLDTPPADWVRAQNAFW